jgi:hypothetical protein
MNLTVMDVPELESLLAEVQDELRKRREADKIVWLTLDRALRTASSKARYEAQWFPVEDDFNPYYVAEGKLYEVGDDRPLDPNDPNDRDVLEGRFRFLCLVAD